MDKIVTINRILAIVVGLLFLQISYVAVKACDSNVLLKEWHMEVGCYKRNILWQGEGGRIFFSRLDDSTRLAHGGYKSSLPSAVIYLEKNKKIQIIKKYCKDFCFIPGNKDYLPQAVRLYKNIFLLWAPENRLSNRHGTEGYLELYDANKASLRVASKVLNVSYENIESPIISVDQIGSKITVIMNTIDFKDNDGPQGYLVIPAQEKIILNKENDLYTK